MSDDDPESFNAPSPFSFTGPVPPFFTRSRNRPSGTFPTETPTDFLSSTPLSTSFDVSSLPTPTQTADPTDTFPSSTGTLDTSTPTSGDSDSPFPTSTDVSSLQTVATDLGDNSSSGIPFDSSSDLFITPSQFLTSTTTSFDDPFSTSSSVSFVSSFTTDLSSTSSPSFTTSGLSVTTSSSLTPTTSTSVHTSSLTPTPSTPVATPSPTPSVPTSSQIVSPQSSLSRSSSSRSPVTTTSFPSFAGSPQGRTSSNDVGIIVAATTGSIALAIVVALLAILCRKRRLRKLRQRDGQDPFHNFDLDGETAAVNQPLITGDGLGPGGGVYSDPFTDESRLRHQSRSFSATATTGPTTSLDRSNNSFQAVAGPAPVRDPRSGPPVDYYKQPQPAESRSPPPFPLPQIARNRSPLSLPQVQTKLLPELPVPRQSSPSFDAGAIAYLRNNDQTGPSPPSPPQFSPGNTEDHRLISAFSAGSGLSPQYSSPGVPPPSIGELWRSSPEVKASSSLRSPVNRGHSFTPSISGHVYDPGDTIVIAPPDLSTKSPLQSVTSPTDTSNPYPSSGEHFGSRPSPIQEVTEHTHSHEGSNNSGGTWNSSRSGDSSRYSPVVLHAHRVQLTPTALSLVSPQTPSTPSQYGESPGTLGVTSQLPPLPPVLVPELPQVQPLSLGKKRPP